MLHYKIAPKIKRDNNNCIINNNDLNNVKMDQFNDFIAKFKNIN